jgi:hypothetical protein
MQDITAGSEKMTFQVRQGDFFSELADNFNSMIVKMERKKD